MATHIEELVLKRYGLSLQAVAPDAHYYGFRFRWVAMDRPGWRGGAAEFSEVLAIHFARRQERQPIVLGELLGHHVVRQELPQVLAQFTAGGPLLAAVDNVGNQTVRKNIILTSQSSKT